MRPKRRRVLIAGGIPLICLFLSALVGLVHPKVRFYGRMAYKRCAGRLGIFRVRLDGARERLRVALDSSQPIPFPDAKIIIHKEGRKLELFSGDRLVKSCAIGLGRNPRGHKQRNGDGRTPEGRYFLCSRRLHTKDHLFLGINYPNTEDAQFGLKESTIGSKQYEAIRDAERNRRIPPWDTPLGGAIGIHGGGTRDWTAGCISLHDGDVEELYLATGYWTPVGIRP